jgi:NADP-dependent 3-hydroxy acid dehydrogenase YdfG
MQSYSVRAVQSALPSPKSSRLKVRAVFLAGRTKASLEAVAKQIMAVGGKAQATVVDALDDNGVNRYLDDVAKQAGKIDVLVDLTGPLAVLEREGAKRGVHRERAR